MVFSYTHYGFDVLPDQRVKTTAPADNVQESTDLWARLYDFIILAISVKNTAENSWSVEYGESQGLLLVA